MPESKVQEEVQLLTMIENVWLILAALGISNVVEQIDRYVFQVSPIPFIEYDSYQYSLLAGTLFSVVYCVGVILFSLLNEKVKLDRITIVALSCGISSIALACIPFVTQFWHLAVLRLFMGFAQSPITVFCASFIKTNSLKRKGVSLLASSTAVHLSDSRSL